MNSRIRRIKTVTASAVTALGLVALATPVSASVKQTSASPSTAMAVTQVSFGCGSVPTFVSSLNGGFTGLGIRIRSGPSTSCSRYGLGNEGDTLKVWCEVANAGVTWVYLNDRTTGVRGWSDAHYVAWSGSLPACT
jgi:hypothetical protein